MGDTAQAQPSGAAAAEQTQQTQQEQAPQPQSTQAPQQDLRSLLEEIVSRHVDHKPEDVHRFEMNQRQARLYCMSGLFGDIKGKSETEAVAQAFVKIELGASMGFTSAESMTGIDIIQGRLAIGAQLRGARMQKAGFSWVFLQHDDKGCEIALFYQGKPVPGPNGKQATVGFNENDAKLAGLLGKDNYKKHPKNMYFARTITNAQRFYAPGVLGGADILSAEEAMDLPPASQSQPQFQPPQRKSEAQSPVAAASTVQGEGLFGGHSAAMKDAQ